MALSAQKLRETDRRLLVVADSAIALGSPQLQAMVDDLRERIAAPDATDELALAAVGAAELALAAAKARAMPTVRPGGGGGYSPRPGAPTLPAEVPAVVASPVERAKNWWSGLPLAARVALLAAVGGLAWMVGKKFGKRRRKRGG